MQETFPRHGGRFLFLCSFLSKSAFFNDALQSTISVIWIFILIFAITLLSLMIAFWALSTKRLRNALGAQTEWPSATGVAGPTSNWGAVQINRFRLAARSARLVIAEHGIVVQLRRSLGGGNFFLSAKGFRIVRYPPQRWFARRCCGLFSAAAEVIVFGELADFVESMCADRIEDAPSAQESS